MELKQNDVGVQAPKRKPFKEEFFKRIETDKLFRLALRYVDRGEVYFNRALSYGFGDHILRPKKEDFPSSEYGEEEAIKKYKLRSDYMQEVFCVVGAAYAMHVHSGGINGTLTFPYAMRNFRRDFDTQADNIMAKIGSSDPTTGFCKIKERNILKALGKYGLDYQSVLGDLLYGFNEKKIKQWSLIYWGKLKEDEDD